MMMINGCWQFLRFAKCFQHGPIFTMGSIWREGETNFQYPHFSNPVLKAEMPSIATIHCSGGTVSLTMLVYNVFRMIQNHTDQLQSWYSKRTMGSQMTFTRWESLSLATDGSVWQYLIVSNTGNVKLRKRTSSQSTNCLINCQISQHIETSGSSLA